MVDIRCKLRTLAAWRLAILLALSVSGSAAQAITVKLDYAYDTTGFFGATNPSGAAAGVKAKAALEAAASFFSGILNDTFSAIQTPPDFHSAQFNGVATWNWTMEFNNPTTNAAVAINNPTVAANDYRIYAGAIDLTGTTLGVGGTGGYHVESANNNGGFSFDEISQIDQITDDFFADVQTRDEGSEFAAWGGAITFDRVGPLWHYDHTTAVQTGESDFYSVAIHELGHALGLGGSSQWLALAGGSSFSGLAAKAANGGVAPPLEPPSPTRGHWRSLPVLMSQVYGTTTAQEVAMDPDLTAGTRKYFTNLDAAALTDIGWEVSPPQTFNPADFNTDTFVNGGDLATWKTAFGAGGGADADDDNDSDGADFLIWQRNLGAPSMTPIPEPAAVSLALIVAGALGGLRRRCRARQAASIGRI